MRRRKDHHCGRGRMVHKASMGPPPCGGGKYLPTEGSTSMTSRFNGAASMRRRKVDCRLRDAAVTSSFNGAASMRRRKGLTFERIERLGLELQWGRLHAEAESPNTLMPLAALSPRFNGAASMRRRKGSWSRARGRSIRSFNGAASMRRRKVIQRVAYLNQPPDLLQWGRLHAEAESVGWERNPRQITPLQWGRLHAEAERRGADADYRARGHASMGPPPCGGGKPAHVSNQVPSTLVLQWGRLHAEAESPFGQLAESIAPIRWIASTCLYGRPRELI